MLERDEGRPDCTVNGIPGKCEEISDSQNDFCIFLSFHMYVQ